MAAVGRRNSMPEAPLHPLPIQVLCGLTVLWACAGLGGLLDGRPRARRREGLRLASQVLVAAGVAAVPGYAWLAVALLVTALAGLAGVAAVSAAESQARAPTEVQGA